jgi:hypothetical protein
MCSVVCFPGQWISCGGQHHWPPKFPVFNFLHLYVWGHVEDRVCQQKVKTQDVLHEDMTERFKDLLSMEIPDWVINPFSDIGKVRVLEEELMELQNDCELKSKFNNSYQEFWLQKEIPGRYPAVWRDIKKLIISFARSYLVEHGFSVVVRLL